MSSLEVSYQDIDLSIGIARMQGGAGILSRALFTEVAVILPDGNTTLYELNRREQTAVMHPGMHYLGVMRREGLRKKFAVVTPDRIIEGGRLVLANQDGIQSIRPKIVAMSNKSAQVDSFFSMHEFPGSTVA